MGEYNGSVDHMRGDEGIEEEGGVMSGRMKSDGNLHWMKTETQLRESMVIDVREEGGRRMISREGERRNDDGMVE